MAAQRRPISISLPIVLIKQLDKLAKTAGTTRSKLIEDLCDDGIHQAEATIRAASDPTVMNAMMRALVQPGVLRGLSEAMREDLSEEQLKLFAAGVNSMTPKQKGKK
jgi:hypothetical protein